MIEPNYLAIVAAAVVVFVLSAIYYTLAGRQLARLSTAYVDGSRPPAWEVALELVRNVVVAVVVARLVAAIGTAGWAGAVVLAVALWIGFPVVLLGGSVIHERVPPKLAVIHAGDWLVKLLVIAVVVSVWR